jgi:hypothetical protein
MHTNQFQNQPSAFTFDFHLERFLDYNHRRNIKDWRNPIEERIIKENEEMHQHFAAVKMPDECFTGIQLFTDREGTMYYVHR